MTSRNNITQRYGQKRGFSITSFINSLWRTVWIFFWFFNKFFPVLPKIWKISVSCFHIFSETRNTLKTVLFLQCKISNETLHVLGIRRLYLYWATSHHNTISPGHYLSLTSFLTKRSFIHQISTFSEKVKFCEVMQVKQSRMSSSMNSLDFFPKF